MKGLSSCQQFTKFLKMILEAEVKTDQIRAQLFYSSSEDIFDALSLPQDTESVTFDDLTLSLELKLSQEQQKTLKKYFGFNSHQSQNQEAFCENISRPVDNKLIVNHSLAFSQKQSQRTAIIRQSTKLLIQSILEGYHKTKAVRQTELQSQSTVQELASYFCKEFQAQSLTKESLKQFIYEVGLYSRVNFNYLKNYILGDQQEIGWGVLFKVDFKQQKPQPSKCYQMKQKLSNAITVPNEEVITQLSEEYLASERQLKSLRAMNDSKQHSQNISHCEIQNSNLEKTQNTKNIDFEVNLSEITEIERALKSTKLKYQLEHEQFQKQEHHQALKEHQRIHSLNQRPFSDYTYLKIQKDQEESPLQRREKEEHELRAAFSAGPSEEPFTCETTVNFDHKSSIEESRVQSYLTKSRNSICSSSKKIESESQLSEQFHNPNSNNGSIKNRQIGRIKRRSLSKDQISAKQLPQSLVSQKVVQKSCNQPDRYQQYEAVLKQIKKEENSYKQIVEEREKFMEYRKMKKRLNLKLNDGSSQHSKNSYPRTSNEYCQQALQSPIYSTSTKRNSQKTQRVLAEIQNDPKLKLDTQKIERVSLCKDSNQNSLSSSRVSSQKRSEIVSRATSEAKKRIQEIENRALNKLSTSEKFTFEQKKSNWNKYEDKARTVLQQANQSLSHKLTLSKPVGRIHTNTNETSSHGKTPTSLSYSRSPKASAEISQQFIEGLLQKRPETSAQRSFFWKQPKETQNPTFGSASYNLYTPSTRHHCSRVFEPSQ